MLILGPKYSPEWDGRPPGMTHDDWPIWLVWRWNNLISDQCYYYNVRVGIPAVTPSGAPENYRRQWELSSMLRLDAIGISSHYIHIYEVKSFATPQDLWQLSTYAILVEKELSYLGNIQAWLIAESIVPGLAEQAKELNIQTWTPFTRS